MEYVDANQRFAPDEAVVLSRALSREDAEEIAQWLATTEGLTGSYWGTTNHWYRGKRAALYLFTDPNTATAFKMRFG